MGASIELAAIVPATTAEGPMTRFALWVQGCDLACPACCNPHMFTVGGGTTHDVDALLAQVARAQADQKIEGITVLGGEPLQQLPAVTALCEGAQALGLGVIVFSGYRRDEAQRRPGFDRLWSAIDTLVDGRYQARSPEPSAGAGGRRFIGSGNQSLCHRTDRYRDPRHWHGPARVEVQLDDLGRLDAHGEPGALRDLLRAMRR